MFPDPCLSVFSIWAFQTLLGIVDTNSIQSLSSQLGHVMDSLLSFLDLARTNAGFFMTVECRYCRLRSQQGRQGRGGSCRCRDGLVQAPVDSLDYVLSHRFQQWAREAAATPSKKNFAVENQLVSGYLYLIPNAPAYDTFLSFFIESDPTGHPKPARLAKVPAQWVRSFETQFVELTASYASIAPSKVGPAAQEQPGMTVFGQSQHPCIEFSKLVQADPLDIAPLQNSFAIHHRKAV